MAQQQRGSAGVGVQRSRAIPSDGNGRSGQVSALGDPHMLCLRPSHQQIGEYIVRLSVILRIGSLHVSQGLGFSFPFEKAPKHQPACEQASHVKATEQQHEKL